MKKIITIALLAGSLMSIFGATVLFAEENQSKTIGQKAKENAATLKEKAAASIKKTDEETKALAEEAIAKAKAKAAELAAKTKAVTQTIKQGTQEKYVYTKKAVNESVEHTKEKISDMRIKAAIKYAFLISKDIHSLKIDVDVKDGMVQLFGKVKSQEEAEKAMQIALSTKGVRGVESFFLIEE